LEDPWNCVFVAIIHNQRLQYHMKQRTWCIQSVYCESLTCSVCWPLHPWMLGNCSSHPQKIWKSMGIISSVGSIEERQNLELWVRCSTSYLIEIKLWICKQIQILHK
jgi:hypothetical protein